MNYDSILKIKYTSWAELEKQIEAQPTTYQKGELFEQFIFAYLTILGLNAQAFNFQDDIESYQVDAFIGASSPNWTVWSGAAGEGSAEAVTHELSVGS